MAKQKVDLKFEWSRFDEMMTMNCNASDKNRLMLCGKYTVLMQEPNLLKNTSVSKVMFEGFTIPQIDMVVGVPGCGKTTFILNEHNKGDLVLTSSSEGATDIRERLAKFKKENADKFKRDYRTIDSYLLNSREEYENVWIDEALMKHPGEIFLVCLFSKCKTLHLLGDPNQIGYINRLGTVSIRFGDFKKFFSPTRTLKTSYRCPQDVMAALYDRYEGGTKSASRERRTMSSRPFTTVNAIPKDNNQYKYLVFKQSEKELLKRSCYNVSTVHEFQEKQAENIIAVRTSTKEKEEIYNSPSHILVMMSRHTKSFTYYTPVMDDLKRIVNRRYSDNVLNKVQLDIGGGATSEISKEIDKEIVGLKLSPVAETDCVYVNKFLMKFTERSEHKLLPIYGGGLYNREVIYEKILNNTEFGVEALMTYHDMLLPGNSYHDHYLDNINMLNSELDLELTDIMITEDRRPTRIALYDKLKPILKTMMPTARRTSQIESIMALNKRNMAVPDLDGLGDPHALGERLLTQFKYSYFDETKLWMLNEFERTPIEPNSEALEEWLKIQDPSVRKLIVGPDTDPLEWNWNTYKFMIKSTVKPTLDVTAPFVNNALQTIACQEKYHNAVFCPIFREMDRRIEMLYKDKFKVFTRTNNEEFCSKLEEILLPPWLFEKFISDGAAMLEIDISKYDKSQGLAALIFDCLMMKMLGVSDFFIGLWFKSHAHTTLIDKENGVKYKVDYQRKSGDASTFSQNTRFLMAVVATMFDMSEVLFGMFAGDDSWLLIKANFGI